MSKKTIGPLRGAKSNSHVQSSARESRKRTAKRGSPVLIIDEKTKKGRHHGPAPVADTLASIGEPATTHSEFGDAYRPISLAIIHPSPFQHRTVFDPIEMAELKKDVEQNGIHTPLIVRIHPTLTDEYELVTGECRLRTARDLGQATVPAIVRPLTDQQVQEIQWSENYRRKNPDFLDEAVSLRGLLSYHKSVDRLAKYLSKKKTYIEARLRLLNLTEAFREMTHSRILSLHEALSIACLEAPAQEAMFEKSCKNWKEIKGFRMDNVQELVGAYQRDLSRAIFDTADAELVPGEGACTKCPSNTATMRSLFPETEKTGYCNKISCFFAKRKAHLTRTLAAAVEEHRPAAIIICGALSEEWDTILPNVPAVVQCSVLQDNEVKASCRPIEPERQSWYSDEYYKDRMTTYKERLTEFDQRVHDGTLVPAISFSTGSFAQVWYDPRPAEVIAEVTSLKTLDDHIKAKTATPEMIQSGIDLIDNREIKKRLVDQEIIQQQIHDAFLAKIDELAGTHEPTADDQAARRLIIYQSLDDDDQEIVREKLGYIEGEGKPQLPVLHDWLSQLTNAQETWMIRLSLSKHDDARRPRTDVANTVTRLAEAIGVAVPVIRAAQDAIAAARADKNGERKAIYQVRKDQLTPKQ
jgi:ParB/RepB/Spo0J family partition protein